MTSIDSSRRTLAAFGLLAAAGLAAPALATAKSSRRKAKDKHKNSSDAERQKLEDARLTRECKGRPNAGACLGYAR